MLMLGTAVCVEEAGGCIMVMVMDDASPSGAGTTHVSCMCAQKPEGVQFIKKQLYNLYFFINLFHIHKETVVGNDAY